MVKQWFVRVISWCLVNGFLMISTCDSVARVITDTLSMLNGQSTSEGADKTWYHLLFYEATSNCCRCIYSEENQTEIASHLHSCAYVNITNSKEKNKTEECLHANIMHMMLPSSQTLFILPISKITSLLLESGMKLIFLSNRPHFIHTWIYEVRIYDKCHYLLLVLIMKKGIMGQYKQRNQY